LQQGLSLCPKPLQAFNNFRDAETAGHTYFKPFFRQVA